MTLLFCYEQQLPDKALQYPSTRSAPAECNTRALNRLLCLLPAHLLLQLPTKCFKIIKKNIKSKCHNQDKMTKFFQERTLHMEKIFFLLQLLCLHLSFTVCFQFHVIVVMFTHTATTPKCPAGPQEKRARFCLFVKSCFYLFAAWFPY